MLVPKFLTFICILMTELGIKFVQAKFVNPEFWLFHHVFSKYGKLCQCYVSKDIPILCQYLKEKCTKWSEFWSTRIWDSALHSSIQKLNWCFVCFYHVLRRATWIGFERFLGFFSSVTHKILSLKYKRKNSAFFEICRVFIKSSHTWESCFE